MGGLYDKFKYYTNILWKRKRGKMITIKGINKVKMSVWNSNLITSREWKGRIYEKKSNSLRGLYKYVNVFLPGAVKSK